MIRKSFTFIFAALMAFVVGATQVHAQTPVAEISVASFKNISANFDTIGDLLDNSQISAIPKLLEDQLDDNVKSFDKTKPSGAFIYLKQKGDNFDGASFVAFIPVANLDELVETLEDNDAVELDKSFETKGVKMVKVTFSEYTVYAIAENGWTFISDKASKLLSLPKNPAESLGDMPSKYLLAAKINVEAVPASLKDWVIEQIQNGMNVAQIANDEDEEDEEDADEESEEEAEEVAEINKIQQEAQFKALKALIYDVKNLTVGVALDNQTKTLRFELDVNPVENTAMAKTFKAYENVAGFGKVVFKDATVYQTETEVLEESDASDSLKILGLAKDLAVKSAKDCDVIKDKEKFNALVEKTSKVIDNVIKANAGKVVQKGFALFFKPDDIRVVSAVQGASIDGVDALIKEWIAAIDENVDQYFKANVETWKGLTFNVASIPTEKITKELSKGLDEVSEEDAAQIKELIQTIEAVFGKSIDLAYAVGEKEFYFAGGNNAVDLIKKTYDNDAVVPNGQQDYLNVKVGEFLNTLSKFTFIPEDARDAIDAIATEAGEDSVVAVCAQSNKTGGATYRLELNAGAVKGVAAAIMVFGSKLMGGGDDDDDDYDQE